MDQGSKTEPATPRQRQRARERGQVARSVELVSAIMLFFGLLALFLLVDFTGGKLVDFFQSTAGRAEQIEISPGHFPLFTREIITALLVILAPYLLLSTIISLGVNFMQVGFIFTTKPLEPELGRLNPGKGFQRIFSMRGIVELVKNLIKLALIATVAGTILSGMYPALSTAGSMRPDMAVAFAQSIGLKISLFCTALLLILAILDYVYQRFEHEKSIRMSKQEIRDEYKNMEGDPQIKRRIREMGRQFAMSRMFDAMESADAVITNPTHFAVAVQYELEWSAPKVVAKGTDYMAKRLIRYAEELALPIYQQPQLARALYQTELDEFIPGNLFKAVARVLAHLSRHDARLKRKLRGVKPASSPVT